MRRRSSWKRSNHAWEEYASASKRYAGSLLEETANRVAWAAVKRRYIKAGDRWLPRE
jgi:cation transport regulator